MEQQIRAFAKALEQKLMKRTYYGDWRGKSLNALMRHLHEEVWELEMALFQVTEIGLGLTRDTTGRPERVLNEAIDVAALAMMVADAVASEKGESES